jgi:hypothetical protein
MLHKQLWLGCRKAYGSKTYRTLESHVMKQPNEYDSGWCQGLLELHAHINTQIDKPNSQTKKIIEIIVWMLEENDENS